MYRSVDKASGMIFGEHSLASLDGEAHTQVRRAMLAPVLRHPAMAATLIRDRALSACSGLTVGERFKFIDIARVITLNITLQTVFGVLDERERQDFIVAIHRLRRSISFLAIFMKALRRDLGAWSPWGRFIRARARCYELIDRRLAETRATSASEHQSVLAYWATLRDSAGKHLMSDAHIRDNLLTLLFAGHDTTASAIAWSLYWTHSEPGVLITLLKELEDYGKTLDTSLLKNTPYLDAVCWETLRVYPVAPGSARRLNRPMRLAEFQIAEGDLVMACIDLISRDPNLYPEPARFKPERFLERVYEPTEFIPFGGGERRCPGAAIDFEEIRVVLATLICRFQFRLAEKNPVTPVWAHGIRHPKTGVWAVLECKRSLTRYQEGAKLA